MKGGSERWMTLALAAALALAVSAGSASSPAGGRTERLSEPVRTAEADDRCQDQLPILRIIESREQDPRVLRRMREKVDGLTNAQMRSVGYLCSRAGAGDRSAAADLAYALVTALIILS
jgi:hypothetical protein